MGVLGVVLLRRLAPQEGGPGQAGGAGLGHVAVGAVWCQGTHVGLQEQVFVRKMVLVVGAAEGLGQAVWGRRVARHGCELGLLGSLASLLALLKELKDGRAGSGGCLGRGWLRSCA